MRQTANVTMDSSVQDLGGGQFLYTWIFTNVGTGDFFQFFQAGPGQGPNFLQPPVPLVAGGSITLGYDRARLQGDFSD